MALSISVSMLRNIATYLFALVPPVFIIFGLFGNVATFLAFKRLSKITPTVLLLLALAFFDSVYMVTTGFVNIVAIVTLFFPARITQFQIQYMTPVFLFLWSIPSYSSNWTIVAISLERSIAVLLPLKVKALWTKRTSIIAIIICSLVPIMVTLSRILLRRSVQRTKNSTMETDAEAQYVLINGIDLYETLTIISVNIFIVIPVCLVFLSNLCISICLFRNSKIKESRISNSYVTRSEKRITKVLLMISIFFCCCLMPYSVITTYNEIAKGNNALYSNTIVELISYIGYLLLIVNSSMNFVFYAASSKKFRNNVKTVLSGCRK